MNISLKLGCMLNILLNLHLQAHEESTITLNWQFLKGDWLGEAACLKTQLAQKHSSPCSLPADWWGGRNALPVDSQLLQILATDLAITSTSNALLSVPSLMKVYHHSWLSLNRLYFLVDFSNTFLYIPCRQVVAPTPFHLQAKAISFSFIEMTWLVLQLYTFHCWHLCVYQCV